MLDFKRIQVKHLVGLSKHIQIKASFNQPSTILSIMIACDEVAGIHIVKEYKPDCKPSDFPSNNSNDDNNDEGYKSDSSDEFVDLANINDIIKSVKLPHSNFNGEYKSNQESICKHTCKNKSKCKHGW